MKISYVPILRAKEGEFDALRNLYPHQRQGLVPLMDIQKFESTPKKKAQDYLSDVARDLVGAYGSAPFFLDLYWWAPSAKTESGEHVLTYAYGELAARGANAHVVIGYDRWEDAEYSQAVRNVLSMNGGHGLLRLDNDALEDMADPEHFDDVLGTILHDCNQAVSKLPVLIDLGDLCGKALMDLIPIATGAIQGLKLRGFKTIILAGSSMPATINEAVKKQNSVGFISRQEMILWKTIFGEVEGIQLVPGDYGVRSPRASDAKNPKTNGKIRYTVPNQYFIARGHPFTDPPKGAQMWGLSRTVMDSGFYRDETFSWGDKRIDECSRELFKGTSTMWIANDTSHHIASVLVEVAEFSTTLTPTTEAEESQ